MVVDDAQHVGYIFTLDPNPRYTRGLPPSAAPQPSALARDLAELSQRSVSGAEAAARMPSPDSTPRTAPLQLEHWRLLEGGEALPVCRDSVRLVLQSASIRTRS